MTPLKNPDIWTIGGAVEGLLRGDFSRLEPLFHERSPNQPCQIIEWYKQGAFDNEPTGLAEAFTCACFLGQTSVANFLLESGVDPTSGNATWLDGLHWAANRGHLSTVRMLLEHGVPIETRSLHGGTALGTAIWSAINEPRGDQMAIIEALVAAGAKVDAVPYPTGNAAIDQLLRGRVPDINGQ